MSTTTLLLDSDQLKPSNMPHLPNYLQAQLTHQPTTTMRSLTINQPNPRARFLYRLDNSPWDLKH
jgi:hypothetical protein